MASRRDELNAYTFARRRLVAQFLRPHSTGSEEGVPRPWRAVLPGVLVGTVGLAGFGAWGMFKPVAPRGWQAPYEHIIVGSRSTTRYVVLTTKGEDRLHPVLNMASARLLVNDGQEKIVRVDDAVIDRSPLPRGATVGIPYAPDRLPDPEEAGRPKTWAVCERAELGGRAAVQTAVFVLAQRDRKRIEGPRLLTGGQLLYVQNATRPRERFVVDAWGTAYPFADRDPDLRTAVVGRERVPQRVSQEWLNTLHEGSRIELPVLKGVGRPSLAENLPKTDRKDWTVGRVLRATDGTAERHYVVLADRVAPVSDFMAKILLNSRQLTKLRQHGEPQRASAVPWGAPYRTHTKWPVHSPAPVNSPSPAKGHRNTVCSILRSVDRAGGATTLSTWAGTGFPRALPTGSTSAGVTPGSGQLFRQFTGSGTGLGPVFLVTDSGLRHTIQTKDLNEPGDRGHRDGPDPSARKDRKGRQLRPGDGKSALELLGYTPEALRHSVDALAPIPAAWSTLLPTGPRLSAGAAVQLQGS